MNKSLRNDIVYSFLALSLIVSFEVTGLLYLRKLPFSRINVINTTTLEDIYWNPVLARGNSYRSPSGIDYFIVGPHYDILPDIRSVISEEMPNLENNNSTLMKAIKLRKWVRSKIEFGHPLTQYEMFDYHKSFELMDSGKGLCDAFSILFVGAALSMDIPTRLVHLTTTGGPGAGGHYVVEVWIRELNKWVMIDVLYNCRYEIDGMPLSALEIHNAYFINHVKPTIVRDSSKTLPDPNKNSGALKSLYKHIQIINRTDLDEYGIAWFDKKLKFINWVDAVSPPLGRMEKILRLLLCIVLPVSGAIVFAIFIFLVLKTAIVQRFFKNLQK